MNFFNCRHKFSKVRKDGYQYCEKCGEAIVALCKHNWQRIKIVELEHWGNKSGHIYISECTKCLKIGKETIMAPWMNSWYDSLFNRRI